MFLESAYAVRLILSMMEYGGVLHPSPPAYQGNTCEVLPNVHLGEGCIYDSTSVV